MEENSNYYNVTKTTGKLFTEIRVFSQSKPISTVGGLRTRTNNYNVNTLSRIKSNHRAKKNLIDLVNNNFYHSNSSFITLTFRENIKDIDLANTIFKSFIRKVRNKLKYNLKYIAVVEFQKRGAIHYHLVSNIFSFDYSLLVNFWNKSINSKNSINNKGGYIKVKRLSSNSYKSRVSFYISKYMSKSFCNPILYGKKCYFTSRNLDRSQKSRYLIPNAFSSDVIKKLNLNGTIEEHSFYYDYYNGKKIKYYLLKNI